MYPLLIVGYTVIGKVFPRSSQTPGLLGLVVVEEERHVA